MAEKWTAADIPSQKGRVAIVTGANSGIGLIAARELAAASATVVLACRDTKKGESALRDIKAKSPDAVVTLASLDLASLQSVRDFADGFNAGGGGLDLLINNAGVMAVAPRRTTATGAANIGSCSDAISANVTMPSVWTMRSRICQSGPRTLHLPYCSQSCLSVEHAVTVNGPSIASITSATLIDADGRLRVYPPRVP